MALLCFSGWVCRAVGADVFECSLLCSGLCWYDSWKKVTVKCCGLFPEDFFSLLRWIEKKQRRARNVSVQRSAHHREWGFLCVMNPFREKAWITTSEKYLFVFFCPWRRQSMKGVCSWQAEKWKWLDKMWLRANRTLVTYESMWRKQETWQPCLLHSVLHQPFKPSIGKDFLSKFRIYSCTSIMKDVDCVWAAA